VAPDTTAPPRRAPVWHTRRSGGDPSCRLVCSGMFAHRPRRCPARRACGALVPSNGHDFLAAFLVMLGVPVSIGPLCRFRTDNRVCTHTVEFFPTPGRCSQRTFEVGPRKDHRGGDLISDALPFGRLWHNEPDALYNAIGYAKFRSRSHRAVICVYDSAGNPA
jgi:hypothetical protein